MRAKLEKAFLALVRLYTYYTPIAKGKYRLHMIAISLCSHLPDGMVVPTKDGRKLIANLSTGTETSLYFHGEYETAISEKVVMLLREGDVCLDVGANFGWYTTLFHKHCGADGSVHAFEPVPATYQELTRNVELIGSPANVFINHLALGDRADEITINLFPGLPTGHASISTQGRDDAISFQCQMITLDSYLESNNGLNNVNFIKVDIEGSELMFLNGAKRLFDQDVPPIWLIEMALQQTNNFGYTPNDLLQFLKEQAAYDFFAVDEPTRKVKRITAFDPEDIGANVFCIPTGFYQERTLRFLMDEVDLPNQDPKPKT